MKNQKIKKISLALLVGVFLLLYATISHSHAAVRGQVVEAETGEPIEGAIVVAEWTVTTSMGFTSTQAYKIVEIVTDVDGKFYIPGVWKIFINPLKSMDPVSVVIYKRGYTPWRNDYSFPEDKRKKRFRFKKGSVIKLQLLEEGYSNRDKIESFLPSMGRVHIVGGKFVNTMPLYNSEIAQLSPGASRDREIKRVDRLKLLYGEDYRAGKILNKETFKVMAANMARKDYKGYRDLEFALNLFKELVKKTATKEITIIGPGVNYRLYVNDTVYVNEAAVTAILENMDITNENTYSQFIRLLGMFRDERIVEVLIKLLDHPSEWVRHSAVYSLGRSGDKRVIPHLIPMLKDKEGYVQGQVVRSLGMFEDERVFELLIESLNIRYINEDAVRALSLRKDPRSVEPLINLLRRGLNAEGSRSERGLLHINIIALLGLLGDERAIYPLIEVMLDKRESEHTRRRASEAISRKFKSDKVIKAISSIVLDRKERDVVRISLAHFLLEYTDDPLALETLEKLLGDNTVFMSYSTRMLIEDAINSKDDANMARD